MNNTDVREERLTSLKELSKKVREDNIRNTLLREQAVTAFKSKVTALIQQFNLPIDIPDFEKFNEKEIEVYFSSLEKVVEDYNSNIDIQVEKAYDIFRQQGVI